jgi:hypothetical protein
MTAVLEGTEWSAARPGLTLPLGKTRYPLYSRPGGPQGRSGRAENLVPTGIRSRTVQPIAQSLYQLSYPAHNIDNSCGKTVRSQHVQLPVQGRKFILYSGLMEERGSRVHISVLPLFSALVASQRHATVASPPGKGHVADCVGRWVDSHVRYERVRKNSPPPGFDPPTQFIGFEA